MSTTVDFNNESESQHQDFMQKQPAATHSSPLAAPIKCLLRIVLAEGLATFLFMFSIMACSLNNNPTLNDQSSAAASSTTTTYLYTGVSSAFAGIGIIYAFFDVCGAHLNPAVTFATMLTGHSSLIKGVFYIFIQLIASTCAAAYLGLIFQPSVVTPAAIGSSTISNIASLLTVSVSPNSTVIRAFFIELSLTFILVYVIYATAIDKGQQSSSSSSFASPVFKNQLAPLIVGVTIGFLCFMGSSVSGGAFNPARVFGPAVVSGQFDYHHWMYWAASFLGAGLGAGAQRLFSYRPRDL